MANNPYLSYSRSQLENAPAGEQIAALFNKASHHMKSAGIAIQENDIAARYEASQKATTILEGLMSCLNRDIPERAHVATELENYYKTMITLIGRMNVYNDLTICSSLEIGFSDMANFWQEASKAYETNQQQETSVPSEANLKA